MLSSKFDINISLGAFHRVGYVEAMNLSMGMTQPLVGHISTNHAQLCPQNSGLINEEMIKHLQSTFKDTQFRLHANAGVLDKRIISDLSNFQLDKSYWNQLAKMSKLLNAPAYSAHAGRRVHTSLNVMIDNARHAEDLFGCPVAVEGHYPAVGNPFLVSTWKEYQAVFDSGVHYAVDLSHLNIVASHFRRYEQSLVREMLSSDRCIEVHLSGNAGKYDSHDAIEENPIWLDDLDYIHADATIFSECQPG